MRAAVIYRRVSSRRQSDEGKSLEDQDAELLDYCHAMKWEIIGNFQDVQSGRREKTEKRVGLSKAIARACEHKATLVVYDLDRLARSQSVGMRIIEQLRDCGAKLVVKSLGIDTDTPAGEMIVGVMFAIAQWGSRNIGAGVKRAHDQTMREKGFRTQGKQRYGWRYDEDAGQLVEVPEQQELIAQVKGIANERKWSVRTLTAELNARGVPTPRGGKWHPATVLRMLKPQRKNLAN